MHLSRMKASNVCSWLQVSDFGLASVLVEDYGFQKDSRALGSMKILIIHCSLNDSCIEMA